MSSIFTLRNACPVTSTVVPDIFIDEYMPPANGEFVKIYLYLLRIERKDDTQLSLSLLADVFSCTEKDILRALKYWQKAGIVLLAFDENKKLSMLTLLPYPSAVKGDGTPAHTKAAQVGSSLEKPSVQANMQADHAKRSTQTEAQVRDGERPDQTTARINNAEHSNQTGVRTDHAVPDQTGAQVKDGERPGQMAARADDTENLISASGAKTLPAQTADLPAGANPEAAGTANSTNVAVSDAGTDTDPEAAGAGTDIYPEATDAETDTEQVADDTIFICRLETGEAGDGAAAGHTLLPDTAAADRISAAPTEDPASGPANRLPQTDTPGGGVAPAEAGKPLYHSPREIAHMKEGDPEISVLLYISEQYLKKTLSVTDMQHIVYLYDDLHFSVDLIEYLIGYCADLGHRSIHYIEQVALSWHADGITTVRAARERTRAWSRSYYPILKAFGIRGRDPIPSEIAFMDRWLTEYEFSLDIIQEACSRTIQQTAQPNFKYAEGILSKWKKDKVRALTDIEALDAAHAKRQKNSGRTGASSGKAKNDFNNFEQREYDYDKLEEQLLKH